MARSPRTRPFIVLATVFTMVLTANQALADESTDRTVSDEDYESDVRISGEGDCDKLEVEVDSGKITADIGVVEVVTYSVTEDCMVSDIAFSREGVTPSAGDSVESKEFTAKSTSLGDRAIGFGAAGLPGPGGGYATNSCGSYLGNYIHTSSTLQDIVNIDIAKLRYHTDRKWNGCYTSFKPDRWGSAHVGVIWNHITSVGESWYQSGSSSVSRTAKAYGGFHSDFLWCNLQPGQNFWLYNYNKTYPSGSYGATFTQSRTCSGTHMATAKWTSTNRNG